MTECPVCGYQEMEFPCEFGGICSCCGTLFGEDDTIKTHAQLRQSWIDKGMKWFSTHQSPPDGWDADKQLQAAIDA